MPDDFNPEQPADGNDLSPPQIPDPDESATPTQGEGTDQRLQAVQGDVADMKEADAPSEGSSPEEAAAEPTGSTPEAPTAPPYQDFSPQRTKSLADEVQAMGDLDKPMPVRGNAFEQPTGAEPATAAPAPSLPTVDTGDGAIPQTYHEFQQAVSGMKRADGQPWHANAVANQYRRYRELGFDNGTEVPAGQEHLEIEARESDRAFYKEDKQRFQATTQLAKLLTQNAIENMREITQLKDALIRNRH